MPVFNEAKTLPEVVRRVLEQPLVAELIAVDDGSSDGSWPLLQELSAREPRLRIFRHDANRGKGAALRTGFGQAAAAFVIIQDADLEYDPAEYARMLEPILEGRADVVFGSRFLGGGAHRLLNFWHHMGNCALTMLSNVFTHLNLTDIETCYKAFRREVIQAIRIEEDRFGIEPEITAKLARMNVRIFEVPISYHGRTYAEGKKIGWWDGLVAIRCIFVYWFKADRSALREGNPAHRWK